MNGMQGKASHKYLRAGRAVALLQVAGMAPERLLFQSCRAVRLGHLPACAQSMGSCPSKIFCCRPRVVTFCTLHHPPQGDIFIACWWLQHLPPMLCTCQLKMKAKGLSWCNNAFRHGINVLSQSLEVQPIRLLPGTLCPSRQAGIPPSHSHAHPAPSAQGTPPD